jgi:MoaA/NifB/PqqE/SkfB family radical SAM enzyme
MLQFEEIRRIHVELTTRCNARCPMCMRNYRGYDYNSGYPICELSLADFKRIFTPEVCASLMRPDPPVGGLIPKVYDFRGVSFNGNLGDFASARDAVEIVEYLVKNKVRIIINTNGSVRSSEWWSRLALPGVTIGFAIDGLADTHSLYRQDTDWHRIIEHAQAFINAGGQAVWRFVPFDHNCHQEEDCKKLSRKMGFAWFENIYDGRNSTPVFTRTGEFSHQIGTDPRPPTQIPELKPMLENHITWYDKNKITLEADTPELNINCIHKRNKEIYIAADGGVYPCCFLGFYPGQMKHPGNDELAELIWENNALEHSLEHCMQWFDRVEQTWQQASIADGRLYQCVKTCNRP